MHVYHVRKLPSRFPVHPFLRKLILGREVLIWPDQFAFAWNFRTRNATNSQRAQGHRKRIWNECFPHRDDIVQNQWNARKSFAINNCILWTESEFSVAKSTTSRIHLQTAQAHVIDCMVRTRCEQTCHTEQSIWTSEISILRLEKRLVCFEACNVFPRFWIGSKNKDTSFSLTKCWCASACVPVAKLSVHYHDRRDGLFLNCSSREKDCQTQVPKSFFPLCGLAFCRLKAQGMFFPWQQRNLQWVWRAMGAIAPVTTTHSILTGLSGVIIEVVLKRKIRKEVR